MTRTLYRPSALLAAAILAAVPAIAQHSAPASVVAPTAEITVEADAMLGNATVTDDVAAMRETIMSDALMSELEGDVSESAILAARMAYAQQLFEPLWTDAGVTSLLNLEKDLFAYGLASDDIVNRDLEKVAATYRTAATPEIRAEADIKLTAAWMRMTSAISGTLRDEGEAAKIRTNAPVRPALTVALLDAANGNAEAAAAQFEPTHPQYKGLKKALRHYRERYDDTTWLAIPAGDAIEEGDTDERVPALRNRLVLEGYDADLSMTAIAEVVGDALEDALEEDTVSDVDLTPREIAIDVATTYDADLAAAVMNFQRRHGLEADGVIGGRTLEALNESPDSKIDRIADTMNRWRSHGDLGQRYIWANIPSYLAEGWSDGKREIRQRTIVGKVRHATPTFSDEVEYVVANPKWFIPVSIMRRDKMPKLARDPGYAARGGYSVYDRASGAKVSAASVDWTDPSTASKYRMVQGSGDGNALGEMKIIFPNQYSVYLHGTPGKHLFDEAQRAFSSGCVRLEDPAGMAKWLARHDENVEVTEIVEALEDGDREKMSLGETTPVHITYMTVTVNDEGKPVFWRDVYDKHDDIEQVKKYAPLFDPSDVPTLIQTTTPETVQEDTENL